MNSIETMVKEHDNILAFLKAVKNASLEIMEGAEPDTQDFRKMIDFVRTYADGHHHGKEEKILFVHMLEHLGKIGTNLITHGMLVEHDLGRLYMSDLEKALASYDENPSTEAKLEIVANAAGYANLLQRHIDKENDLVFKYAEKNLPPASLKTVNEETEKFEKDAMEKGTVDKYMKLLAEMSAKYKR
ncbi:MAG: hemerythrin domain-containing protein [Proteocatella sp.]